jgi:multicomponent Na+:H+ antiporter subunit C
MRIILVAILFGIGIWGVIAQRNVIKKIIALSIINSAVVALFVVAAAVSGDSAPILGQSDSTNFVDPVPQALMLTAIVVGFSLTAVGLVFAWRLFEAYGTLDMNKMERQSRKEDDA